MANVLTTTLPIGHQFGMVQSSTGVPIEIEVQAGTGSVDASAVTYTPGDPTDWPIPPPGDVSIALDILANPRGLYAENALLLGPAVSLTPISLPAVVPTKSGVYMAWVQAEIDGNGTTAAIATCVLLVDGVPQGQTMGVGYAPGSWSLNVGTMYLVTVNRAIPHAWDVEIDSNSAAGFSIAQGRAKLMLLEM